MKPKKTTLLHRIDLTPEEAELLLPQLKAGLDMDKGDPPESPPNAEKNWRSMIAKLKSAIEKPVKHHEFEWPPGCEVCGGSLVRVYNAAGETEEFICTQCSTAIDPYDFNLEV